MPKQCKQPQDNARCHHHGSPSHGLLIVNLSLSVYLLLHTRLGLLKIGAFDVSNELGK